MMKLVVIDDGRSKSIFFCVRERSERGSGVGGSGCPKRSEGDDNGVNN